MVAGSCGWHVAIAAPAVLAALVLVSTPLARLTKSAGTAGPQATGSRAPRGGQRRTVLLWTVAAALATIGSNAAASYFIQIGTHSGLSVPVAGMMQSLAGAVAIAVRLAVGLLADRAPSRNPAVVVAMMASGALGMALISLGTPVTFAVGAMLTVAGGWGWTGLRLSSAMRLLPAQGARAAATMQIGLFGGAAVAPLAFGALSSSFGISTTVLVEAVASLVACGAVVAGAVRCGAAREGQVPAGSRYVLGLLSMGDCSHDLHTSRPHRPLGEPAVPRHYELRAPDNG